MFGCMAPVKMSKSILGIPLRSSELAVSCPLGCAQKMAEKRNVAWSICSCHHVFGVCFNADRNRSVLLRRRGQSVPISTKSQGVHDALASVTGCYLKRDLPRLSDAFEGSRKIHIPSMTIHHKVAP